MPALLQRAGVINNHPTILSSLIHPAMSVLSPGCLVHRPNNSSWEGRWPLRRKINRLRSKQQEAAQPSMRALLHTSPSVAPAWTSAQSLLPVVGAKGTNSTDMVHNFFIVEMMSWKCLPHKFVSKSVTSRPL